MLIVELPRLEGNPITGELHATTRLDPEITRKLTPGELE